MFDVSETAAACLASTDQIHSRFAGETARLTTHVRSSRTLGSLGAKCQ